MAVDERPFALSMISLLLLDLDGVVAIEMVPPQVARLEIILLHELLHEMLSGISVPVVVLTHRSRAEANLILQLAGLTSKEVAGVIAAEDNQSGSQIEPPMASAPPRAEEKLDIAGCREAVRCRAPGYRHYR